MVPVQTMVKQYKLKDQMLISNMVLRCLLALILFIDFTTYTRPVLFIYLFFTCARVIRIYQYINDGKRTDGVMSNSAGLTCVAGVLLSASVRAFGARK